MKLVLLIYQRQHRLSIVKFLKKKCVIGDLGCMKQRFLLMYVLFIFCRL